MGLHSTFLFNTEKERMTQKYFQCTPYWQEAAAASADQFWHPFTNVLFRPSDDPAIPDSAGPRITLWAHCFLPQSAGRQLQDDRAIRQQVHTKLIRIATALREIYFYERHLTKHKRFPNDLNVGLARASVQFMLCGIPHLA
jgi:hypothetical protein